MSYCRLGLDSDVYVYSTYLGGLECCGCSLEPDDNWLYETNEEMIAHLLVHKENGHKVPDYALNRLRDPQDARDNRLYLEEQKKKKESDGK